MGIRSGEEELAMPWKEICPMEERARFIIECLRAELSMTALCRQYGLSRKTAYKWWGRFEAEGRVQLADRSRACLSHPNATPAEVVTILVEARKRHPTWGPRKLIAWLEAKYPRLRLPAPSTAGDILQRQGMVHPRRRRRQAAPYTEPFLGCDGPNAVWCADFKGGFAVGNGRRCNPLTISDAYSRYLLRCEAMTLIDEARVRPTFESAFCEFGLPQAIRTDNGPPFATVAPGGLSRLAIWWIKLGIRAERIALGVPQQNGRHERMHRTLKAETARPPARTLADQQRAFDRFRRLYNDERPHEALGQKPPWTAYEASSRRYPVRLREPEYPDGLAVRTVRHNGSLKWKGAELYVGATLAGEHVGLKELGEGRWRVYFADVPLGVIERNHFHRERGRVQSRLPGPKEETQA
jgi:transposase InsO family protein